MMRRFAARDFHFHLRLSAFICGSLSFLSPIRVFRVTNETAPKENRPRELPEGGQE
jgi:hypothetical protein